MKNLYLNKETSDLELKNFNLRLTENNTEWLSQRIENEFKFFYGEWFAEQTRGLDHFGKVLKKQVDVDQVYALYYDFLKNITGVSSIESFEVDYVRETRTYTINFVVISEENETVEGSVTV
ncbi:MAG: hypothetical protein PVI88_00285 [Nitrosopumilaceae archaeon]|jgi:hypothetical protein